jgi:DNA-binding helix-hairpin-helix protein with protein kinase domain
VTVPRTVTSIHGNRYRLGRELGRGGQGAVFAVEGQVLAVKLLRNRSPSEQERLRDQLAMVGRLPLEDLAIARPIEQLRPPDVGYVMELFTGMVPIRSLLRPPKEMDSVARWYAAGGGLRRRLRLLARAAEVFGELHGRGLVYVDPAPDNVVVSEAIDASEVRLIDTDNLRPSTSPGPALFTPGYGAPEIVRETGAPTSLSDAYAFAVLAFETLTLTHPFLGDIVQRGDPELEEQAWAGALPWIEDPDDDCNRASTGIPRDLVLSDKLREIFRKTFEAGRMTPVERPGMARWAEYLHRAADRTLPCRSCGGSYYFNREACPWCEEQRPPLVIGAVQLWDPAAIRNRGEGEIEESPGVVRDADGRPRVFDAVVVSLGEQVAITDRITHGTDRRIPRLRLAFDGDRLSLEALDGERWRLVSSDGRYEQNLGDRSVHIAVGPPGAAWKLHAGPADRPHRVLRFDLLARGGGR